MNCLIVLEIRTQALSSGSAKSSGGPRLFQLGWVHLWWSSLTAGLQKGLLLCLRFWIYVLCIPCNSFSLLLLLETLNMALVGVSCIRIWGRTGFFWAGVCSNFMQSFHFDTSFGTVSGLRNLQLNWPFNIEYFLLYFFIALTKAHCTSVFSISVCVTWQVYSKCVIF